MDPGVLQTIGLKRVEHDLATEQQQPFIHLHFPSPRLVLPASKNAQLFSGLKETRALSVSAQKEFVRDKMLSKR